MGIQNLSNNEVALCEDYHPSYQIDRNNDIKWTPIALAVSAIFAAIFFSITIISVIASDFDKHPSNTFVNISTAGKIIGGLGGCLSFIAFLAVCMSSIKSGPQHIARMEVFADHPHHSSLL